MQENINSNRFFMGCMMGAFCPFWSSFLSALGKKIKTCEKKASETLCYSKL